MSARRRALINKLAAEAVIDNTKEIEQLRKKFKRELDGTHYGTDGIGIRSVVFYVPLDDLDRISFGILVGIDKSDTDRISRLVLKNPNHNTIWKIKPQKVYLFWRNPFKRGEPLSNMIHNFMNKDGNIIRIFKKKSDNVKLEFDKDFE